MKINVKGRIQLIDIKVAGRPAGRLNKNAQFEFTYHSDARKPVSVTMPLGARYYQGGALFPIFEMNIPEGYVRYRITERLRTPRTRDARRSRDHRTRRLDRRSGRGPDRGSCTGGCGCSA